MRILVLSDLHLEFGEFDSPAKDVDAVILAGDIWYRDKGIRWAAQHFKPERTIYMVGNHEFYNGEVHEVLEACRLAARETGVHFLENDSVIIDGVRFIGTALWADFRLNGQALMIDSMKAAWRYINDFRLIRIREGEKSRRLLPADVIAFNKSAVAYLQKTLTEPFIGRTVVATHFPPSARSIALEYRSDPTAPYFCASQDDLITSTAPDVWIHGHTHDNFSYRIGRTRILCNPRGYHPDHLNPNFNSQLVIEL